MKKLIWKLKKNIKKVRSRWIRSKLNYDLYELYDSIISIPDPRSFIQSLIKKIKKSIKYAKIAWNEKDWDCNGLFELSQAKLEDLEPTMRKGYGLYSPVYANEIKLVIVILDKVNNSRFGDRELYMDPDSSKIVVTDKYFRYWRDRRDLDIEKIFKIIEKRHAHWWD